LILIARLAQSLCISQFPLTTLSIRLKIAIEDEIVVDMNNYRLTAYYLSFSQLANL
jgi:hypothetical protein